MIFSTAIRYTSNERFVTHQLLPSGGNEPSRSAQLAAEEQTTAAPENCFQTHCPGREEHKQTNSTVKPQDWQLARPQMQRCELIPLREIKTWLAAHDSETQGFFCSLLCSHREFLQVALSESQFS